MKIKIICFLLGLFAVALDCYAYENVVRPFRYNNLLPSEFVQSFTQDRQGMIWIGTSGGVVSYDGYELKELKQPPFADQFVMQAINCIYADNQDNIWIARVPGVYKYNKKNGAFRHILFDSDHILDGSNVVNSITQARDGKIYFGTRNGIYYLTNENYTPQRLSTFPYQDKFDYASKGERVARRLVYSKKDILWVGTEGAGLVRLDLENNTKVVYKHIKNDTTSLVNDNIEALYEDKYGYLWVGTTNGLCRYRYTSSDFKCYSSENIHGAIKSITESPKEAKIFVGTDYGLFVYDRVRKKLRHFVHDPRNETISSNMITASLSDRSGLVWIGTTNGLSLYDKEPEVTQLQSIPGYDNSIVSNQVVFLKEDTVNKRVWIGTKNKGLDCYHVDSKRFSHYGYGGFDVERNMLSGHVAANGDLLIGTENGLLRYNNRSNRLEEYDVDGILKPGMKNIYAVIEDRAQNIYMGVLDHGLFKVNKADRTVKKIHLFDDTVNAGLYNNIKLLYEDSRSNLWITLHRLGVVCYNPDNETVKHFIRENSALSSNAVWAIKEISNRQLLLGTINGISVYDLNNNTFVKIKDDPYRNDPIMGIMPDNKDDALWIVTNKSTSKFYYKTGKIINFSGLDRMTSTFNYQSCARIDSLLFVGGDNGVNIVNMNQVFNNTFVPIVSITSVERDGVALYEDEYFNNDGNVINIDNNSSLKISVSSFSYLNEWRNRYKYRIKGVNEKFIWLPIGENKINISGLSQGNYELEVVASNGDGVWGPIVKLCNISVVCIPSIILEILFHLCAILCSVWFLYLRFSIQIKKRYNKFKRQYLRYLLSAKPVKNAELVMLPINNETQKVVARLNQMMEQDKLFLNKRFNKTQLASLLELSEQQLTQLLKECYGKKFPEYINSYRIDCVKNRLQDPKYKDYTLLAIGQECGFNSKTSFYRVFKEFTGYTPAEYLEKINKNQK